MVLHDVVSHPGAIFVPLTPAPWKVSNIPLQAGMSLLVIKLTLRLEGEDRDMKYDRIFNCCDVTFCFCFFVFLENCSVTTRILPECT